MYVSASPFFIAKFNLYLNSFFKKKKTFLIMNEIKSKQIFLFGTRSVIKILLFSTRCIQFVFIHRLTDKSFIE